MKILLCLVSGYIIGSVSFAYLFTRFLTGKDIRQIGTGNPGAANVARSVGKKWGVIVWLGDTMKGVIPMFFAKNLGITNIIILTVIGISVIFGHCYSIFLHFKGGKGAATTGGIILFLMPLLFPLVIILWFVVQKTNPRSIKVLLSCVLFYFVCLFFAYGLRINMSVFVQTSISTVLLIITGMLVNPDVIRDLRSKKQ
ncbi:MAG TPA: glycerol-3-phosphate acyltransferase [bacterium]|nr:glycerol-3-phosphate acyltransferase [bacterium]HPP29679.1 glycerol-3-phosphate acyltransferase [bacterium]